MQGKRAMLLASVGALAALMSGVPAQAQSTRMAVWGDRTGFDDYDWIDRADAISEAVGEAPPDSSFIFERGEPWAWTLEDGSVLLVEQLPDGPHGYYFEPGSDTPFLVRDPEMSYGFIDGAVAVVYGADGQVLSREEGRSWLGEAMRGYERGRRLKRAMAQGDRQRSMNVGSWYNMSYLLFDWWDDWDYGLRRNPAWRRHHDGPRGIEHRRRWEHERQRREVLHNVFQRWGQGGYRGRAPGRFTPPTPGTPPPPHRWDGHGRDGRGGHDGRDRRDGWGEHRPRTGRDPQVEGGLQTDLSVNPAMQGGRVRGGGRPDAEGGRPMPRSGWPTSGGRPRPEPQVQAPEAVPTPMPVTVTPAPTPAPAPAIDRPLPTRPDRGPGGRVHVPQPMPETSGDDAPPRPSYSEPRPMRSERPAFSPPAPQRESAPSFTPPPRPERSYTPPPSPAPTRSYMPAPTPAPSYTPSPAPTRSYAPSPAPAPARSTPTPSPEPSRSQSAVRAKED